MLVFPNCDLKNLFFTVNPIYKWNFWYYIIELLNMDIWWANTRQNLSFFGSISSEIVDFFIGIYEKVVFLQSYRSYGCKSNLQVIDLKLESNADIISQDTGGSTPLHLASRMDAAEIVERFMLRGAHVNTQDCSWAIL